MNPFLSSTLSLSGTLLGRTGTVAQEGAQGSALLTTTGGVCPRNSTVMQYPLFDYDSLPFDRKHAALFLPFTLSSFDAPR